MQNLALPTKTRQSFMSIAFKGIYYMLEPSNTIHINNTPLHYNASNNLMLTLEFGVSFGIPPMSSKDFTRKSPY